MMSGSLLTEIKKMPIKITVMSRVKFVKLGQQKWMKEFNLATESKKN